MSRIIAAVLLFSFCLQGFHFVEEPTPLKLFMLTVPLALAWNLINFRGLNRIFVAEIMALMFFSYMVISALWAEDMGLAFIKVAGIILLIVSYYSLRASMAALTRQDLLRMISIGGILVVGLSLLYYATGVILLDAEALKVVHNGTERGFYGVYLEGNMVRMRGLFDSPNNLALICVFLFLFYDFYKSSLALAGKALSVCALILTLSLTGWLSLIAAYIFGMIIKRQLSVILLAICGVSAAVSVVYWVVPDETLNPMIEARVQRISTGSGRIELYELAFSKIAEQPIWGYGLNQARVVLKEHRNVQSTHNSIVESAMDGGLVAVVIYLLAWLLFVLMAFRLSWLGRKPFYVSSAIGLLVFSQANLLTYVELTVFYYALWFEIAAREANEEAPQLSVGTVTAAHIIPRNETKGELN